MASVAVARFGGALRSGAAVRTMRTFTGPSPSLARAGWLAAGAGNKRCMSTVYAESHEYLTVVRGGVVVPEALLVLSPCSAAAHDPRRLLDVVPRGKLGHVCLALLAVCSSAPVSRWNLAGSTRMHSSSGVACLTTSPGEERIACWSARVVLFRKHGILYDVVLIFSLGLMLLSLEPFVFLSPSRRLP